MKQSTRKKPVTTEELFDIICEILKEKGKLPDILDYGLATHNPVLITNYEYGLVILNGWRYEPVYFENTMRYEPIGDHKEGNVLLVGHDIQPLIDYLKKVDLSRERRQCT